MPVYQIVDEMPEDELFHWRAREQIKPMSEDAGWIQSAQQRIHLSQTMIGKKASKLKLTDFLPDWMTT